MTFQGIFQRRHLVVAIGLHVVLLTFLFVGVRCSRKVPPPPVVQGVLLNQKPAPEPQRQKQQEEERRKAEEEQKRKAAEEAQRRQQEEQARQAAEQEAKRQAEIQEKQRKAEAEKQQKLAQQRQQEEARKKAQEEAQRKAEEEAQRKAEAERKRKEEEARAAKDLQRKLQSEEQARENAAQQNEWIARITSKVQNNWLRPPAGPEDFSCGVHVTLLPDGTIVSREITQSCGSPVLDDSVLRALDKSSPLPLPENPNAFDRDLNFTFTPK